MPVHMSGYFYLQSSTVTMLPLFCHLLNNDKFQKIKIKKQTNKQTNKQNINWGITGEKITGANVQAESKSDNAAIVESWQFVC